MATVPKLNYANLRGKSKSKDSEFSQRKIENNSSDLFSHMNQDNLKYIQSQIKQKHRRNNQNGLKKKTEQGLDTIVDHEYPQKIDERQSKYEETEREKDESDVSPHLKIMKTEGESVKLSINNQSEAPFKKVSEEAETNKLSYYDLVSQGKSKRVSSIEAYYQQQNHAYGSPKQTGGFLNFLSSYIQDLNVKAKKQKKKINISKGQHSVEKEREKANSIIISSPSEGEIIKGSLAEQKLKNECLAKQIEQYRLEMQNRDKRMEMVEKYVVRLDEEVGQLRRLVKKGEVKGNSQNVNMYEYRETNHLSHRKNLTSFLLVSNDRMNRNKEAQKQLNQLEKQYEIFRETGQCRVSFKQKIPQYD